MRKRKLIGMINRVADRVNADIAAYSEGGGKYRRGLAREGYLGGYLQALRDVDLASSGARPNTRRFWDDEKF